MAAATGVMHLNPPYGKAHLSVLESLGWGCMLILAGASNSGVAQGTVLEHGHGVGPYGKALAGAACQLLQKPASD